MDFQSHGMVAREGGMIVKRPKKERYPYLVVFIIITMICIYAGIKIFVVQQDRKSVV